MASSANTQLAVARHELMKRYPGGFVAVRDDSLAIPGGASRGLRSENGAGKSTLIATSARQG